MKTYHRLVRRRVEAALQLRMSGRPPTFLDRRGISPDMDDPFDDAPVEIIDLATGPFERQFAQPRSPGRSRRR